MRASSIPQVRGLAPDAAAAIDAWPWPGNVRELENRVKRAVILCDAKLIGAGDLDLNSSEDADDNVVNLRSAREAAESQAVRRAIARSDGNISTAAKMLGISRPTLYDLMKGYNIRGENFSRRQRRLRLDPGPSFLRLLARKNERDPGSSRRLSLFSQGTFVLYNGA